jgi:hypothetical protein
MPTLRSHHGARCKSIQLDRNELNLNFTSDRDNYMKIKLDS